jgi:hypothetical protein
MPATEVSSTSRRPEKVLAGLSFVMIEAPRNEAHMALSVY